MSDEWGDTKLIEIEKKLDLVIDLLLSPDPFKEKERDGKIYFCRFCGVNSYDWHYQPTHKANCSYVRLRKLADR